MEQKQALTEQQLLELVKKNQVENVQFDSLTNQVIIYRSSFKDAMEPVRRLHVDSKPDLKDSNIPTFNFVKRKQNNKSSYSYVIKTGNSRYCCRFDYDENVGQLGVLLDKKFIEIPALKTAEKKTFFETRPRQRKRTRHSLQEEPSALGSETPSQKNSELSKLTLVTDPFRYIQLDKNLLSVGKLSDLLAKSNKGPSEKQAATTKLGKYLDKVLDAKDWSNWPMILQPVVLSFRQLFFSKDELTAMRVLQNVVNPNRQNQQSLLSRSSQKSDNGSSLQILQTIADPTSLPKPKPQQSLGSKKSPKDRASFQTMFHSGSNNTNKHPRKDVIALIKEGKAVLKAFDNTDGFNHVIETIKDPTGKGKEKNPNASKDYSKEYVVKVDRERKTWKVVEENKTSHSDDAKSTSFSLIPKTGPTRTFNQQQGTHPIAIILDFDSCRKSKYAFHGKNAFTNKKWWRLNDGSLTPEQIKFIEQYPDKDKNVNLPPEQIKFIEQFIESGFDTFEEYSAYVNSGQMLELPETYLHPPSVDNLGTIAVAIVNPEGFNSDYNKLWAIYEKIQIEKKLGVSDVQIVVLNTAEGVSNYSIEQQKQDVENYFKKRNKSPDIDDDYKGLIELSSPNSHNDRLAVKEKYFTDYFAKAKSLSPSPF